MKQFILFILVCLALNSCGLFMHKNTVKANSQIEAAARNSYEQQLRENEAAISKLQNKYPAHYWGEGISNIGADLGEAKEQSKVRARTDLSRTLKVQIKSDLVDIMGKYQDDYVEIVEQKAISYTNAVFEGVEGECFYPYPALNNITCFYWISIAAYKEKVRKDLEKKKSMIKGSMQNGKKALWDTDYVLALTAFAQAKNHLLNFFGNVPIMDDSDSASKAEELSSVIDGYINEILSGINITTLDPSVAYTSEGKINKKPLIYAQYVKNNAKQALPNLPLKAEIIEGEGEIVDRLTTGINGETYVLINLINPAIKKSVVRVKTDLEKLGISAKARPVSGCEILLSKARTVALSVVFENSSTILEDVNMFQKIKSASLKNNLNTLSFTIKQKQITSEDKNKATLLNADYLLAVLFSADSSKLPDYDMYAANATVTIEMYSLPDGSLVFSETGPVSKGFGTNRSAAGWDAIGKIKEHVLKLINTKLEQLR
ncbi:MAG: hypothetical protein ABIA04_15350 [Pseudomonadota bacterium]